MAAGDITPLKGTVHTFVKAKSAFLQYAHLMASRRPEMPCIQKINVDSHAFFTLQTF